jgi:hypothetical protein
MPDDYMAMSEPHFSLLISDEPYRSVLAIVERWRNILSHLMILIQKIM